LAGIRVPDHQEHRHRKPARPPESSNLIGEHFCSIFEKRVQGPRTTVYQPRSGKGSMLIRNSFTK